MLSTEHSLNTDYTITESLPGLLESLVAEGWAHREHSVSWGKFRRRGNFQKRQEVGLVGHRGSAAARFSDSFHRQTDLVFRTGTRATWRPASGVRGGGMFLARQTYLLLTHRSIYSSRCLPQPRTPQTLPKSPEKVYLANNQETDLIRKKQT